NTAVVLPAILLGRAIDTALALERGTGTPAQVTWAAVLFVGGTLLTEGPRIAKRWWLMTANARIRANVRADAVRGVLAWRIADRSRTVAERNLSLTRLKGGLQPIYTTVMIAGVVVIVWQGSERVVAGVMTVGAFVAYLELFLRFVNRGHRIPQLVNSVQSG